MQKLIYGNGLTNTQAHDLAYRAKNNRTLPIQDLRFIYDNADNGTSLRNLIDTQTGQIAVRRIKIEEKLNGRRHHYSPAIAREITIR